MTKTTTDYELTGDVHTARIVSQGDVLISWQGVPLDVSKGAVRVRLRGSGTLSIDNPTKGKLKVETKTKQEFAGEALNEDPVPQIAPPQNWLQAMRQRIQTEMGTTREAFASQRSIYELGDVDVFEEDLIEQAKQDQQVRQSDQSSAEPPAATTDSAEVSDTSKE